ncbi:hypothetical protein [Solidesulfovibrio alcoholivorans]|uniref:hypothetical protein n=1 Tax=Solidesulfovibrio alcoholivorans TaxID=81406 RepID=UPI00049628F2|nr:hypothetical protein [Solidesulfovibrio alcoholivorans]
MAMRQRACKVALVAVLAVAALVGGSTVASRQEPARGYGRVLAAAKNAPQPVPDAASDRLMAVVLLRQSERQALATDAGPGRKACCDAGASAEAGAGADTSSGPAQSGI